MSPRPDLRSYVWGAVTFSDGFGVSPESLAEYFNSDFGESVTPEDVAPHFNEARYA